MSAPQLLPEQRARARIDVQLAAAGWTVQNRDEANLSAARGVAVREFKLATGHGFVDYLLFLDGKAVGLLEAKPEGHTLTGVEHQAKIYAKVSGSASIATYALDELLGTKLRALYRLEGPCTCMSV